MPVLTPIKVVRAKTASVNSEDDHGGGLRVNRSDGCTIHHHQGALQSIAKFDALRERKSKRSPPAKLFRQTSDGERIDLGHDLGIAVELVAGRDG
jgi:hypothetical protein